MNKTELSAKVAEKTGLTKKDSEAAVDATFETIVETLATGVGVDITKVLKLDVVPTAARKGRNPQTGVEIDIPAGQKVKFKPLKAIRELF